jgi:hypothetical protein
MIDGSTLASVAQLAVAWGAAFAVALRPFRWK